METATAYQKSIIGEEDRIKEMNRMVDHVLLGGEIHYAYTDLIANYAGPPARWWPHPKLNKNLGATKIYEALDGFVGEEPVTYRIVPMKVVRYAVADDMGLIGGTTDKQELALRWLAESNSEGCRLVRLVEQDISQTSKAL